MTDLSFKYDEDSGSIEVYADGKYVGDISPAQADQYADRLKELANP